MCAASGKDGGLVRVRVAVPAEMEAGVVGPDVGREVAGASGAPRSRSRGIEAPSDGPFIVRDEGAAGAVGANGGKFGSLRARLHRHAVRSRDFDNGAAERQAVRGGDFARFREIPPHLRVEVDEAYHHGVGGTFEGFGHFGEGAQVVFGRVAASEQNRVIAPAYRIDTDNPRKASENLQESVLVGDVWLDVAPVGGDCHKPELAVRAEPIHVFEHRGGILCAEADGVNDGRVKAVAPHLARVVRVPDADEALFQPAREPLRVEGGDIGSLACVDDHGASGGVLCGAPCPGALPFAPCIMATIIPQCPPPVRVLCGRPCPPALLPGPGTVLSRRVASVASSPGLQYECCAPSPVPARHSLLLAWRYSDGRMALCPVDPMVDDPMISAMHKDCALLWLVRGCHPNIPHPNNRATGQPSIRASEWSR